MCQDPFSILTTIIITPFSSHPFKPPFITHEKEKKVNNSFSYFHGGTIIIVVT
jgi:hypothetical protein